VSSESGIKEKHAMKILRNKILQNNIKPFPVGVGNAFGIGFLIS
jgi:hypothetical protein